MENTLSYNNTLHEEYMENTLRIHNLIKTHYMKNTWRIHGEYIILLKNTT
jgi:hypothetical protein